MIDRELHGRMTAERFDELIAERQYMSVTVYIPREATALSLGAQAVARALTEEAARRGQSVQIVRTGSRGLFWLEPLIEVQTAAGRMAYGPVQAGDVPGLFARGLPQRCAGTR